MIYEDFVRTLLASMGLPYEKADAGAARDGVNRLVRLSAMVDDLLAEAGYDAMFDTREKCIDALRQDIKAKLGTAPVDREVLAKAMYTSGRGGIYDDLAKANDDVRDRWLAAADTALALFRPAPAAKVVDQEGLAKAIYDTNGPKAWPWGLVGPETKADYLAKADAALKYIGATSAADETRARNLLADEVLRLRPELADAQRQVGLWRDTAETQRKMRLDLAAEQDKLVAALDEAQNQLAAERERAEQSIAHYTTCSMQYRADRDAVAAELAAERKKWPELKAEVERLKKLNAQIDIARDQYLRDLLSERRKNADLRTTNKDLMERPAHKPLDRDRIRLALLDFSPTVNFINDLADHLVKRLA